MGTTSPALTMINHARFTRFTLMILTVIMVVSYPLSSSAQTLSGTDFVTESGDHTMSWNDNWTASLVSEDEFSTMVMLEGQIMIYAVMFIHDEDLNLSLGAVYQSLSGVLINQFDAPPTHSVEWEDDDGAFRGAHLIELSGIDFVLFLRVDPASEGSGPTMQFAAAPVRAFPVSLSAMQEEIIVDGEPVFAGEDGEAVTTQLELESSAAEAEPAPDSSEISPTDAVESPADSAPAPAPGNGPNPLNDRSRLQRDAHLSREQADDGEYISESSGYSVTYPSGWEDMSATGSTIGEFSLISDSGRTVVSFNGRSTTETNRQEFFEDIVARESRYPGYVGSVISDDRLLLATWTADNELAVLEYVFVDDSTVVTIMATISSGNPGHYITDTQLIELNDSPILRDWDELWPEEQE